MCSRARDGDLGVPALVGGARPGDHRPRARCVLPDHRRHGGGAVAAVSVDDVSCCRAVERRCAVHVDRHVATGGLHPGRRHPAGRRPPRRHRGCSRSLRPGACGRRRHGEASARDDPGFDRERFRCGVEGEAVPEQRAGRAGTGCAASRTAGWVRHEVRAVRWRARSRSLQQRGRAGRRNPDGGARSTSRSKSRSMSRSSKRSARALEHVDEVGFGAGHRGPPVLRTGTGETSTRSAANAREM